MVNFIHDFGYKGFGYMEFSVTWNILAGTNASHLSGIVCITYHNITYISVGVIKGIQLPMQLKVNSDRYQSSS